MCTIDLEDLLRNHVFIERLVPYPGSPRHSPVPSVGLLMPRHHRCLLSISNHCRENPQYNALLENRAQPTSSNLCIPMVGRSQGLQRSLLLILGTVILGNSAILKRGKISKKAKQRDYHFHFPAFAHGAARATDHFFSAIISAIPPSRNNFSSH